MRVLQDSRACLCSGRLKEPAGFDIVKQRGRGSIISQYWTRNITLISPSYAMLSLSSVAYIDEELCHTVNTGLHCQFKNAKHRGNTSFFHVLCRQQVQPEDPSPGPWLLSALLKAFPQPEIKPSAQRQTSGCTDSRPGSKQGARGGREGAEGEKERE